MERLIRLVVVFPAILKAGAFPVKAEFSLRNDKREEEF
jgi:hypothetical protein